MWFELDQTHMIIITNYQEFVDMYGGRDGVDEVYLKSSRDHKKISKQNEQTENWQQNQITKIVQYYCLRLCPKQPQDLAMP